MLTKETKDGKKKDRKLLFSKGADLVAADERSKRDLFLRLPYAQRKLVVEYLDVKSICRTDLVMKGNIYSHVAWQNAIKGLHSKAFSQWKHYGNTDRTFGGLAWAMHRRIVLKSPTIEAIYDHRGDAFNQHQQFFWLCERNDKVHNQLAEYLVRCQFFKDINESTAERYFPLFTAAEMEQIDVLKACIKAGAEVDQLTFNGFTALYFSCQADKRESVKALLQAGADPNLVCGDGGCPLLVACQLGNAEVVKLLLENGADANVTKGPSPKTAPSALHVACTKSRNIEMVRILLAHGAKVDGPTMHLEESQRMETPFLATVYLFDHPLRKFILRELAKYGADVNYSTKAQYFSVESVRNGPSPYVNGVLRAVMERDHDLLSILMEVGADINGFIKGNYEYVEPGMPQKVLAMVTVIGRQMREKLKSGD